MDKITNWFKRWLFCNRSNGIPVSHSRHKQLQILENPSMPKQSNVNIPADRISLFKDTQHRIATDPILAVRTQHLIEKTKVYAPGFQSHKKPDMGKSLVFFEENLTLLAAAKVKREHEHVCVLNFANPVEPGGGVLRGANAQEEYLCRASNLYSSLTSPQAAAYYDRHLEMARSGLSNEYFLASDAAIYSPDVTVFREDVNYYPDSELLNLRQDYTDQWMQVDIITCAAPYFRTKQSPIDEQQLLLLFTSRFRNILEIAIEHDVTALVLGAFGCGAFNNPPAIVAQAAQNILLEPRYRQSFKVVVFAVKRNRSFCENIEAFERCFSVFPPTGEHVITIEGNKRRFFE